VGRTSAGDWGEGVALCGAAGCGGGARSCGEGAVCGAVGRGLGFHSILYSMGVTKAVGS